MSAEDTQMKHRSANLQVQERDREHHTWSSGIYVVSIGRVLSHQRPAFKCPASSSGLRTAYACQTRCNYLWRDVAATMELWFARVGCTFRPHRRGWRA